MIDLQYMVSQFLGSLDKDSESSSEEDMVDNDNESSV